LILWILSIFPSCENSNPSKGLLKAVRENNLSVVQQFLSGGGDPNIIVEPAVSKKPAVSLLSFACFKGRSEIVKLLLEKDINFQDEDQYPLIRVIEGDQNSPVAYANTCKVLLDSGKININMKNSEGNTALMLAASYESFEKFQMLLRYSPDTEIVNAAGKTVLDYIKVMREPIRSKFKQTFDEHKRSKSERNQNP
jgi:ankyrin repeat protein